MNPLHLSAIICCILLISSLGCSSRGGEVTFEPINSTSILTQTFNQAYVAPSLAGEFDIILVDSAADWDYRKPAKNRPLEPIPLSPMQQVMHIHLYWQPLVGTSKNPAAINASITWHVLGPGGSTDVLVYEGAGYVTIENSGQTRHLLIRDGTIAPKLSRGQMTDPIGHARISGSAIARYNEARVRDTISQMNQQLSGATEASTQP